VAEIGELLVCATPIGNLGDVSDRLRNALSRADVVFAEDTRRVATLLHHIGASPPVRSLFVGNEHDRSTELISALEAGQTVALVSDAGMPAVSDPGSGTIRLALESGFPVTVIPGPSAVTSAIALAGFGGDRFVFEGFLPRRGKERSDRLVSIGSESRPIVLFVTPHRLLRDLTDLSAAVGANRDIVVTREMTKLHEEVWFGTIEEARASWSGREAKGEFTIVLAAGIERAISFDEAVAEARDLVAGGSSPSEAARRVATGAGVSRRQIYQVLIGDQDRS
jgi:16S rRNA (cytidine1402-2'-O)-methyltransferase